MTLAARLISAMRRRGIRSQNQLARLSGVSQPSIHRILADPQDYTPGRQVVARLAQALDISQAWLADGNLTDAIMVSATSGAWPTPEALADTQKLSVLCARLSPAQRALLLDMARMLCEVAPRARPYLSRPLAGRAARPP